ncbi:MAG: twin-arginine translocase TatA/TatE family subunit [Candidatus Eisenbacteria bacterium]|uniref:Sec-independent protein translocase protein TatA n=1 Tax=Eiseniibacteriota bacterium TaxID=2212470 RepID=A0A849SSH5_UNCEI|nr:twin-arginine translocase TatA/TatE family subunit [Candidatus Eisenbacteria bacterium]
MFGLGGQELGIIFLIILLVFGPSQIPKMAKSIGQAMREFRKAQREIGDELTRDDSGKNDTKPPDNKPIV